MTSLIPTVALVDGTPRVSSLDIAERFGKRHCDVLRGIKSIMADLDANFTERNFALSEYTDETGRKLPLYHLTRDAFSLVAMGFTGKEALAWKVRYIEAFNAMETELVKQAKKALPAKAKKPAQKALPAAKQKTLLAPKLTIEEDIQLFAEEVKQAHAQVYAVQELASEKLVARTVEIMDRLTSRASDKLGPMYIGKICAVATELLPHVVVKTREALRSPYEHLSPYDDPAKLLTSCVKLESRW